MFRNTMATQAEIQADLLRFSGDLIAGLTEAADAFVSRQPRAPRETALRQFLRYESSALEIATGPMPEVALCDMVVFVGLCGGVFERHWLRIFGEGARPVLGVWNDAAARLRGLSMRAMTEAQWKRLQGLIDDWLRENPTRIAVEGVRFAEFSALVGRIAAERAKETEGIFGSVKSATTAADQALLAVERAIFLVSRLPFVVRLHARLGAHELVSDATVQLRGASVQRALATMRGKVDGVARRWMVYLLGLGAACSILACGGYVAAKRLARR